MVDVVVEYLVFLGHFSWGDPFGCVAYVIVERDRAYGLHVGQDGIFA